jgi:peroxiredoxin
MKLPTGDQVANLAFTVCCIGLLAIAVTRYWPAEQAKKEAHAKEGFLAEGTPDPFALARSEPARPLLPVFISSDCHVCTDSLPFYKRLADRAARSSGKTELIFVSMEPEEHVSAYLRAAGIANVRIASVGRPPGISGTPSILMLDGAGRVQRSWAGRLGRQQERDIENLLTQ